VIPRIQANAIDAATTSRRRALSWSMGER
jgi:hypothetical protein